MRVMSSLIGLALAFAAPAVAAEPSWPDLRSALYDDRPMIPAASAITIFAPYRTQSDLRAVIGAEVIAPAGLMIASVTLVLDENPMPVSTVFRLAKPQKRFRFDATLRINGQTPIHVIAETSDGQLLIAETYVKTKGEGACAAPPVTDTVAALATLGDMTIGIGARATRPAAAVQTGAVQTGAAQTGAAQTGAVEAKAVLAGLTNDQMPLSLAISHPSHSGMQMNQISLLFIPMRYIETVQIAVDGRAYVEMTGSISLSENPELTVSVPAAARAIDVVMTDTDGTVSTANRMLAAY